MGIHWSFIVALLGLAIPAEAVDEPFEIVEPDHLVPLDPHPGDWDIRYSKQVRSRLKLDDQPYDLQMLVRPSFSPEYVVRIYGFSSRVSKTLVVTYTSAEKSIWYSMPENNQERKQKDVPVSTKLAELPNPLATRVYKVWERMLRRTRYPQVPHQGLDGTTYEFSFSRVYGDITMLTAYGEIWSPSERKSPLLFIELGESLIAYCKAWPAEQSTAAQAIEEKAKQLEKYLDSHTEPRE